MDSAQFGPGTSTLTGFDGITFGGGASTLTGSNGVTFGSNATTLTGSIGVTLESGSTGAEAPVTLSGFPGTDSSLLSGLPTGSSASAVATGNAGAGLWSEARSVFVTTLPVVLFTAVCGVLW